MPAVPLYKRTKEMDNMLVKYAEENMILISQLPKYLWISHTSLWRMRYYWYFGINVAQKIKKLPIFKDVKFEKYEWKWQ